GDPLAEPAGPFAIVEEELLRGHRAIDRRRAPGFLAAQERLPRGIEVGDAREAVGADLLDLVIEAERGARGVIEDRLERLIKEGQPVLHAGIPVSRAHRAIERIIVGDGAELLAIATPEAVDDLRIEQDLAHRLEAQLRQRAG